MINYRPSLPLGLAGKIEGTLFGDWETLKEWRHWRTGPSYVDEQLGVILKGALDDTLVDSAGNLSPLDYKTYGFELKEEIHPTYQLQMDCYSLMLSFSGSKTNERAYLIYYSLRELGDNGQVNFLITPREIKTDPDRTKEIIRKAVSVLTDSIPKRSESCTFCAWTTIKAEGGER